MLLQISIPTFNRFATLLPLLNALKRQITQRAENIEACRVVVFDNCSTEAEYAGFAEHDLFKLDNFDYVRHANSIGMEGNILCCYEHAKADYVWIFGDDDMPAQGLITSVIDLLTVQTPDMLYLESKWVDQSDVVKNANLLDMPLQWSCATTPLQLARGAGASLTFLSSIVIKKSVPLSTGIDPRELMGTQMPQMAWVLSALDPDSRLVKSTSDCIVASRGNSGGYKVLDVFACRYPGALHQFERYLRSDVATALRCELIQNYLPGLIYQLKNESLGRFDSSECMPETTTLGKYPSYKLLKWLHDRANARIFYWYAFLSKAFYRASFVVSFESLRLVATRYAARRRS